MSGSDLTRRRILIVEDQAVLAFEMGIQLRRLGCEVVGPVPTLARAMAAAQTEALDGAILDINLNGEAVYPVADVLQSRRIPFLLATGYGTDALPQRFADSPKLEKPILSDDLERLVKEIWGLPKR